MRAFGFSVFGSILIALVSAVSLSAQTITGIAIDGETGDGVAEVFVVLLDVNGNRRGSALTDAEGRFRLIPPFPGRYTLRAERIGYSTTESEPLDVAEGQNVLHRLVLPSETIVLEGLQATGDRRCRLEPEQGTAVHALWEEARKALERVGWMEAEGAQALGFRFEPVRFEREKFFVEDRVREERRWSAAVDRRPPFLSRTAEELARDGYVVEAPDGFHEYFAPDAAVLLSEEFLDTHCFRVERAVDERFDGMIGLAFEPVPSRDIPDIEGVLWLDEETAELRELAFAYTRHFLDPLLPREFRPYFGGRVEFRKLPGGGFVVDQWLIRMPAYLAEEYHMIPDWRLVIPFLQEGRKYTLEELPGYHLRLTRHLLAKEEGGELAGIYTPDDVRLPTREWAALEGIVYDSTAGEPLADAIVHLDGTEYFTIADSAGGYRMTDLPDGIYRVAFTHPRLDTLGIFAPARDVELRRGEAAVADLAVPGWASVVAAACVDEATADARRAGPRPAEDVESPDAGVLVGSVRDASTGTPLAGASVRVSTEDIIARHPAAGAEPAPETREAQTDEQGTFRFCSLPPGTVYTVEAEFFGRTTESVRIALSADEPVYHEFSLGLGQPSRVVGRVLDGGTDEPVAGATVRLSGTAETAMTSDDGRFAFDGIDVGRYFIEAEHVGYGQAGDSVRVEGTGLTYAVNVRLSSEAIALDPIEVEVAPRVGTVLTEVEERVERLQRLGLGQMLTRERIEEQFGGSVTGLLQTVPGVRLIPRGAGRYVLDITRTPRPDGRLCRPRFYVDGMYLRLGDDGTIDEFLTTSDIELIEVYRTPSELPVEFGGSDAACGVIVVWTRRGGR